MEIVLDHHKNSGMARAKKTLSAEETKAIQLTQDRLRYIRDEVKHQTQKERADEAKVHVGTVVNYETHGDPLGIEIRRLVKTGNTTFAFIAGETDDPGPDPFKPIGERSMTTAEKKLLELCEHELQAAIRLRENSQVEYEAARRYREEFERINGRTTRLTSKADG